VGGVVSPLLANICLSVLDRHFQHVWATDMSPQWRRQYRRRTGRPNYRLVRYADDFVVLLHSTRAEAEALRDQIGRLLAERLKMTLSADRTLVTHIDDGFDFLGFRIQRERRGDGRQVVLTIPSKQALAAVMSKIRQARSRYTTSLRLQDVLWVRGWAAYFRWGVAKQTFSYLAHWAWWRLIYWPRRKHPGLSWTQLRRRCSGRMPSARPVWCSTTRRSARSAATATAASRSARLQHRPGRPRGAHLRPHDPRRGCLRRAGHRTRQPKPSMIAWRAGCAGCARPVRQAGTGRPTAKRPGRPSPDPTPQEGRRRWDKRRYTGTAGRVENAQVAVLLVYAS
jgi:hypothetical protein